MKRVRRFWRRHNHVHSWQADRTEPRIRTCRKCGRFRIR